ncbi:MAG TPA: helix-turn-helix transcriptional regulator [Conexibacter sp.]|jgi:DNA-binding XRE family transcriptional regulator|nr:helix-turn-helix transcriptional regulator [Conexibacter sp.]
MRYGLFPSPDRGSSGSSVGGGGGSLARREAFDVDGVLDPAELRALGAAMRELRARRGLSQEELGFRGGLHRNYVGGIERGELNITFRVLLKVARGLDFPLSKIVEVYERNRASPPPLR